MERKKLRRNFKKADIFKTEFSEIADCNHSLLQQDIPCLIISVKKNRTGHIKELHTKLCDLEVLEGVKMILYVEHTVDPNDLPVALWRFCNNMDPKRDSILVERNSKRSAGKKIAIMGLDGTLKTKLYDDFQRNWPNIVASSEETIQAVDAKWQELGIGEFLPSPSLKFRKQLYGEEAVAD